MKLAAAEARREQEAKFALYALQIGADIGVTAATGGAGLPSYLAGVGAFATVGMAADTEIHTDLKTGDYSDALNHASYHLPFIGAGRNAWDALQDNKPWQAAAHAGLLGLEVAGFKATGKVRWGGVKGSIEVGYTDATFKAFQKQLQQHGKESLFRSRASIKKKAARASQKAR